MKLIIILIFSLLILTSCKYIDIVTIKESELPETIVDMENIGNVTCNITQLLFDGRCINATPFNITLE